MVTGGAAESADITAPDYAMGWMTDVYRGHRRVHHGGNIDGFSAMVAFLPDDGLGFVILTNKDGSAYPEMILRTATDRILGHETRDWIGDTAKRLDEAESATKIAEEKKATRKVPGPSPPTPRPICRRLRPSGIWSSTVAIDDGRLSFTYNDIKTNLDHWHYRDVQRSKNRRSDLEDGKLTFRRIPTAGWPPWPAPWSRPTTTSSSPKARSRQTDPAFSPKIHRRYEMTGETVTVILRGNA
jgi:hypothetical protein